MLRPCVSEMDDDKTVPKGRKSRSEYVRWFVYCVQDAAAIQLENNYDVFLDDDNFEMINLDPFRATWIYLYQS